MKKLINNIKIIVIIIMMIIIALFPVIVAIHKGELMYLLLYVVWIYPAIIVISILGAILVEIID